MLAELAAAVAPMAVDDTGAKAYCWNTEVVLLVGEAAMTDWV